MSGAGRGQAFTAADIVCVVQAFCAMRSDTSKHESAQHAFMKAEFDKKKEAFKETTKYGFTIPALFSVTDRSGKSLCSKGAEFMSFMRNNIAPCWPNHFETGTNMQSRVDELLDNVYRQEAMKRHSLALKNRILGLKGTFDTHCEHFLPGCMCNANNTDSQAQHLCTFTIAEFKAKSQMYNVTALSKQVQSRFHNLGLNPPKSFSKKDLAGRLKLVQEPPPLTELDKTRPRNPAPQPSSFLLCYLTLGPPGWNVPQLRVISQGGPSTDLIDTGKVGCTDNKIDTRPKNGSSALSRASQKRRKLNDRKNSNDEARLSANNTTRMLERSDKRGEAMLRQLAHGNSIEARNSQINAANAMMSSGIPALVQRGAALLTSLVEAGPPVLAETPPPSPDASDDDTEVTNDAVAVSGNVANLSSADEDAIDLDGVDRDEDLPSDDTSLPVISPVDLTNNE